VSLCLEGDDDGLARVALAALARAVAAVADEGRHLLHVGLVQRGVYLGLAAQVGFESKT
jgi:hypothetical protein